MPKQKTKEIQSSTDLINEKLEGLFELQTVDSQIDKLTILRGELPLEVSDLELEIEKLNDHLTTQSDAGLELDKSIETQKQKIEDAKNASFSL